MTPEQLLDTALGEDFKINNEVVYKSALSAMRLYALQQSTAFGEYLQKERWSQMMPNGKWTSWGADEPLTTTALYLQFIEHQSLHP